MFREESVCMSRRSLSQFFAPLICPSDCGASAKIDRKRRLPLAVRVSATAGLTPPSKAELTPTVPRAERAAGEDRSAAGAQPGPDQAWVQRCPCSFLVKGTQFKGFPLSPGLQEQLNVTEARCSGAEAEVKGETPH